MVDACLAEVLDLDPRNDDRPIIKEFTTQWLTQVSLCTVYINTFNHLILISEHLSIFICGRCARQDLNAQIRLLPFNIR
jgi:hypothetical protein